MPLHLARLMRAIAVSAACLVAVGCAAGSPAPPAPLIAAGSTMTPVATGPSEEIRFPSAGVRLVVVHGVHPAVSAYRAISTAERAGILPGPARWSRVVRLVRVWDDLGPGPGIGTGGRLAWAVTYRDVPVMPAGPQGRPALVVPSCDLTILVDATTGRALGGFQERAVH